MGHRVYARNSCGLGPLGNLSQVTRSNPLVTRLAVEADCDPRTALAVLEGRAIRPRIRERIEKAAKRLRMKLPKTST